MSISAIKWIADTHVEILPIPEDLDIIWGALLRGKCGQNILSCCETGLHGIEKACRNAPANPTACFGCILTPERIRGYDLDISLSPGPSNFAAFNQLLQCS